MPAYTRGQKRDTMIFVAVNTSIRFGWKSKDLSAVTGITSTDITNLGHQKQSALTGTGLILVVGAQSPKPARVTRKLSGASVGQQQSVNTYCAHDKLAAALGAGWNLAKPSRGVTIRGASADRAGLTAIATLSDGSKYCFPMNKTDFDSYKTPLGLETAATITTATERAKLVSGCSKPRPGKAALQLAGGSTFSSFFSTAKMGDLLGAGYDVLAEEVVLVLASSGT